MDYLKCGDLANITEFFDEAKAKEYRDAAIPELTAAGVTFPIKVQMPYNPSSTSTDWDRQCQVFKQQLEGVLNDGFDFIDIIITAGPSDSFLSSVRRNGKFASLQCNWGADYSDPQTETDPFYQPRAHAAAATPSCAPASRTASSPATPQTHHELHEGHRRGCQDHRRHHARYDAFATPRPPSSTMPSVVPMGPWSIPPYTRHPSELLGGPVRFHRLLQQASEGIHVLDHYISMSEYEANRDAR